MSKTGYHVFNTALGPCGIAWRGDLLVGTELPGMTPAATGRRLAERFPTFVSQAPRGAAARARKALVLHLAGKPADLNAIALDLDAQTPFRRSLYSAARAIPSGTTVTYGELAQRLGKPGGMRAVGQALGANPFPIIVPCHRVLAAGSKAGGFSADGGVTTKRYLLRIEGMPGQMPAGFDYDPWTAADCLRKADPKLGRVIATIGPPRIELRDTSSVFAALSRAIVYQQLSGRAAGTIFARLCALLPRGERDLNAEHIETLDVPTLRGAGLSHNKILALKDLAAHVLSGEVPELRALSALPDEEVIARLTRVRGIGRWTVEMLLMFRLGRADVMAVDDLGLRQGHARILGNSGESTRSALAAHAERWRPYRSVAAWYLWRAVELARETA